MSGPAVGEAGSADKVAESNKSRNGPSFVSQLNTTLQGYHQVIAISQQNINEVLQYHFTNPADPELLKFEYQDEPGEEWMKKISATLGPPTVELLDREKGADAARFYLHFVAGNFTAMKRKGPEVHSVAGWSLAFMVKFGMTDMANMPESIQKRSSIQGYTLSRSSSLISRHLI